MINIPDVHEVFVTLASVSCAKFNNEEYIVTRGQTNHFDFLIRSEIVIATTLSESNHVVHHCDHSVVETVFVGVTLVIGPISSALSGN